LTARPSLRKSPSLSVAVSSLRAPLSARESAADAAARRAALQKAASAASASTLRHSATEAGRGEAGSRFLGSINMQRGASGPSEVGSNGSLSSARGLRSSQIGVGTQRRWA
jgi:hypothetical protein